MYFGLNGGRIKVLLKVHLLIFMSNGFIFICLFSLMNMVHSCGGPKHTQTVFSLASDDTYQQTSNLMDSGGRALNEFMGGMAHVTLNKDSAFDSQTKQAHTIYEICYDFDLNGKTVKLEDDCILYFNGGVLYNGTIIGHNTCVRSDLRKAFNIDVDLKGTWNVGTAYPEWYGAKGDGKTDDRLAIQKTIDAFPNTVLSSKTYLINSVNNKNEKYGLVLGRGKRLSGTRMYCTTFAEDLVNISLVVGDKLDVSSVVRITTLCELNHIGIIGNRINPNSSCVSSEQASRMLLDNVAVAKSNIGFNMKSYLTRYESCYASYCDIGFSIKGGGVKNTTNVLECCQAIDCNQYGYYFNMITYSSLISCAADGCGAASVSNLGYAYYLEKCDCMTFTSCGCEQCLKPIYCQQGKNISFLNCNFLVDKHHLTLPKDFQLTDIIQIRHSDHVKIESCIIDYSLVKKYVADNARLIHLYGSATNSVVLDYKPDVEAIIKKENIGTSGFVDINKNLKYSSTDNYPNKGTSKERPRLKEGNSMKGYQYFDMTLGKPIWWNGSSWVDAYGNKI